ncbi:MAG TPA: hypothetical protein VK741_24040 [Acetobacteraceae bacterium]|jgi:hypothetical protein|nr:hypothetical protein [Acetobacteraceae bacterium]
MTREEKITRYRHLRAIGKQHQNAAIKFVSRATMLDYGRRLGIVQGNTFVCDSPDELTFVFDLAVYTSREGRSRAIDRYARTVNPEPGSDTAIMLKAAQNARFGVWRIEGRHETAGLTIWDVARETTHWLMDEGFEASVPVGSVLAGRVKAVDDFVMTCGAVVPLDVDTLAEAVAHTPNWSARSRAAVVEDPRFATAVFRAALQSGVADRIEFRDPGELQLEMADAG